MKYGVYKESGKFSPIGIVVFLLAGFIGCFWLLTAYVYMMSFLSNLFLRFLTLVSSLILSSLWMKGVTYISKIRRTSLVKLLSIVVIVLSWYGSRCVYVSLVQRLWSLGANEVMNSTGGIKIFEEWLRLLVSPGTVFSALSKILPLGVTAVNGTMIRGAFLLMLWIGEALLLWGVVYNAVISAVSKPFDEKKGCWLSGTEEWTVSYVDNYREIRAMMRNGSFEELENALSELSYYHVEGEESYALLELYRGRHYTGPYITLVNIKAVQSGPRKIDHRAITLCRKFNIGREEAAELRSRIRTEAGQSARKAGIRMSLYERFNAWIRSRVRSAKSTSNPYQETVRTNSVSNTDSGAERPQNEITVHVPRITDEMERQYRKRQLSGKGSDKES